MTFTPLAAKFYKTEITCKAVAESKPVVGSSKKSTLGSVNNSTPIEVRFRSPPETPLINELPTLVAAHFSNPSSSINFSTLTILYSKVLFFNLRLAENMKASK